ncbi:MAG: phosphoribosylanthranilate isomerase [Paracoccaceae bacterium]
MHSKIRVKICGIKNTADMDASIKYGTHYAGLMFFEKSPRFVDLNRAKKLSLHAGNKIKKVAVTVNLTNQILDEIVKKVPLDFIQLHGEETPERVHEIKIRYKLPVIKAIGISDVSDLNLISLFKDVADQLLIDAKPPSSSVLPGGNGLNFDWKLLKDFEFRCPWLLAGGLNSGNAAEAIALTGATQLDLSSGVEKAPGLKDHTKISLFMSAI